MPIEETATHALGPLAPWVSAIVLILMVVFRWKDKRDEAEHRRKLELIAATVEQSKRERAAQLEELKQLNQTALDTANHTNEKILRLTGAIAAGGGQQSAAQTGETQPDVLTAAGKREDENPSA